MTMNTAAQLPQAAAGVRVCLVTEELAGVGSSGGIGAAFLELAQLLASHAWQPSSPAAASSWASWMPRNGSPSR
jgi:hypothetical protein